MIGKLILLSVILTSVLGAPPLRSNVKKDYLMCEVCHVITRDMQLLLEKNATQARVEGYLTEICNRLTANQDGCRKFVNDNIQSVFAKLSDGLDPQQVCILLKVCPSSETEEVKVLPPAISNVILQGTSKEEPESNPIECDICKFIVDYLDKKLVNNRSEEAINATLTELCNKLPGQLGDLCKKLEPQIVKILEDEFLPAKVCKEIKACSAEAALPSRNSALSCQACKDVLEGFLGEAGVQMCSKMTGVCGKIKSHRNNHNNMEHFVEPEQIQIPTGQAECTLCKFVVNEVDNLIQNNQTRDNINASLQKICNSLPGELQGLCETFAPELLAAIENGLDPNMACTKIKLCQGEMEPDYDVVEEKEEKQFDQYDLIEKVMKDADREEKESLKSGPGCALCKLIVSEIDSLIGQNKSAAEINSTVFNLCNKLPAPLKSLCISYAPMIVKDVMAGFDPEKTCEKVRLCTNGSLSLEEFLPTNFKEQVKKDVKATSIGCTLCKFIVQEIDTYIGQNQSAAQVNASVYNLCSKLPAPLNSLCTTYAPMIVKDVLAGFDPELTCEKVRLCTNDSLLYSDELKPRYFEALEEKDKESVGCTICKFIVQEIDTYIGQNQSAAQINASVYNLCSKLPAPLNSLCKTYAPMIVKDVLAGFDPEMTCEKVKLCTNDSLLYSDELKPSYFEELEEKDKASSIGCTLCKFIVQEIDTYIGQNQSAAQVNASVYNLCSKLPAPLNSLCRSYAPMIVKDVLAGFDPEMTCEKVKLCTNDSFVEPFIKEVKKVEKVVKNKVNVDPVCGLCEFVVQLMDQYLAENKTIGAINASIMGICNLLPTNLKAPCILFAPQVVNIVTGGVAPEDACKTINLCTDSGKFFHKELTGLSCGKCHGIVEIFLPKKYSPEFGDVMCKSACPVSRRRRYASNVKQDWVKFEKEEKLDQTWRCDLCEFIIKAINTYLETNSTEQSLEDYMKDICNFMPEPFKDTCLKSVPDIIRELSHGVDQDILCQKYMPDECKNDTKAMENEVMNVIEGAAKDNQCDMCKDIIQYIDEGLNHDKDEVKMYVDDVCERLPSPTSKACKTFAEKELEEILIKIIDKLLTPEEVCHMIRVC